MTILGLFWLKHLQCLYRVHTLSLQTIVQSTKSHIKHDADHFSLSQLNHHREVEIMETKLNKEKEKMR